MKWIHLSQNRDKLHVPPTIIMKLEVLQNVGNLNEKLLTSHKESAVWSLLCVKEYLAITSLLAFKHKYFT